MSKSFNNLWENFVDFENIYHAYRNASCGKRYRREVLKFANNFEIEIITLINELIWKTYEPSPYRSFYICEPKKRYICAPAFRDRIVHHAIVQIISPIFTNRFITETFACIVGRGTHAAAARVVKYTRMAYRKWGGYYVLKCDISKYFPSIDQDILKNIIANRIADKNLLWVINKIIQSHESFEQDGRGIPIGALTSQLFANIYLDGFDHYIKEVCKIKYYVRYMDDFIIIHNDKKYLFEILCKIENYLHDNLKLNLNPKTSIFSGKQGIDFCGYRIWHTHTKPRKSTIKRTKRRFKKYVKMYKNDPSVLEHALQSIRSFLGYVKHCCGWKTTISILDNVVFKPNGGKVKNISGETLK
jgi:retron-type reverse transcriptase